jgi:hypothetical protein
MYPNDFSCINLSLVPDLYDIIHELHDKSDFTSNNKYLKCNYKLGNSYKIIQYNKDILSLELIPTYGLCRSIVVNSKNDVVSFAPPKSVPAETFIENYSIKNLFVVAEEFIEGTMVNVFWDSCIGAWEIATRNSVTANTTFYKSVKTFRMMFLEACLENNINLSVFNKNCCYSFVLQHPENRIVVPFHKTELYLVSVYIIDNNIEKKMVTIKNVYLDTLSSENLMTNDLSIYLGLQNTSVKFPKKIDTTCNTYASLIETYGSMNTPYNILGVVIYNKNTGERTKIRNPVYEEVRQLRGNQPKLQYQYLNLRHQGKIAEFLKYFPENKKDFSNYRDQVHLFTNTLFLNYLACYIKKEKPLLEYSEQYRTHMFQLHQKYLKELRDSKDFVTKIVVQKYVNDLQPALLMYTLNYSLRQSSIYNVVKM